jgi:tRNA threonylcarbamoyladenosine biosynthesis protein TsaB
VRPLILAFDTSTEVCTVSLLALGDDVRLVAARTAVAGRGHTRMLLGFCDEVLREAGAEPLDLGAIVVGTGPGTFTGVRIGIATARAMALSLGIPVVGVSTLAALAAAAADTADTGASAVVPVVDARRGQLFAGVYGRGLENEGVGGGCWARTGDYFPVAPADLAAEVRARTLGAAVAVGDPRLLEGPALPGLPLTVDAAYLLRGQSRLREPAGTTGGVDLASWLADIFRSRGGAQTSHAAGVGSLPGVIAAGAPGSPETVRPLYVRMPDADVHITRMKDPWAS